jgi:hypothetical protein
MKKLGAIRLMIIVSAAGMIAFLALRPSPYIAEVAGVPSWLGKWADGNGVLRNVPAFAGLYLVSILCLDWARRYQLFVAILLLAASIELAQLWIPGRVFAWSDVLASWAGVLLGFVIAYVLYRLVKLTSRRFLASSALWCVAGSMSSCMTASGSKRIIFLGGRGLRRGGVSGRKNKG